MHLAHTCSDIACVVSVVSHFMHAPCEKTNMLATHRILKYWKFAPHKGLLFSKHGHLEVEGYTNVDWVGSIMDRRSTSGTLIA